MDLVSAVSAIECATSVQEVDEAFDKAANYLARKFHPLCNGNLKEFRTAHTLLLEQRNQSIFKLLAKEL